VEQERSAGGGINTRAHNNVTSVLKTLKKTAGHSEQKAWWQCAFTQGCLHPSNAGTFQLGVFDHPPYNTDLAPSDHHLFTYLKNCSKSLCFNCDEELMQGVKMWLSSQAAGRLL
jgi:hypothetical protein